MDFDYLPIRMDSCKMSDKKCCVPNCNVTHCDGITLHCFPNPEKDEERFRSWLYAVGGDVLALDNQVIYKFRRVCHKHFDMKYHTWTKRLSPNAIPTLRVPGITHTSTARPPLADITNHMPSTTIEAPSGKLVPPSPQPQTLRNIATPQSNAVTVKQSKAAIAKRYKAAKKTAQMTKNFIELRNTIAKLRRKNNTYASRLKKASLLSENTAFQSSLKKFTTLAALFTLMQFREFPKKKMGRRFTLNEKIMALSLYKQGPKAYRWLKKIFVLPSSLTLNRLISRTGLKAGINKQMFNQLRQKAQKMTHDEKLCVLLFDEMSINPNFYYNRRKDEISGFVTIGQQNERKICDHALVFMVRGLLKNYKQPLAYTFCTGTTPTENLKCLIIDVISHLHDCGFNVLATVCDQGSTNGSAVNKLIHDTKVCYLRKGEIYTADTFELDGREIIPLFDPPHLIKGIRNNLITKDLKCTIENSTKVAKWAHLLKLYDENPGYKGIRLVKNLTENHVIPKKISKMKVKYATQIFSKTVASNMGYLADKGILPEECKETADILFFFDDLFDSQNGSYVNSKKRNGKPLLGPVTPKSLHSQIWTKSKLVLKGMRFLTKDKKETSIPSITNWIRTLENIEILKKKLFNQYNMKSFWMRHLNQDPLENFFGCIRSHGCRNINPTPAGFESAFTSLLISNISTSSNHSPGSNCEADFCEIFQSMNSLINTARETNQENVEIDPDDLNIEFVNFLLKLNDPKVNGQINYVCGYVLRQAKKKIFKACDECKSQLYDPNNVNDYLRAREYNKGFHGLTYPSKVMLKLFSEIQDVCTELLRKKSHMPGIKHYIKTVMYIVIDFSFIDCQDHKSQVTEFIFDLCIRFFINNWCKETNNILNGVRTEYNESDDIQKSAYDYYIRRNKRK